VTWGRQPPVSHEAEVQLLGWILVNQRAYEHVGDFLRPEHFADPGHGAVYRACAEMIGRGQVPAVPLLKAYFDQDDTLRHLGGPDYLGKMVGAALGVGHPRDFGRLIYELWQRREGIRVMEDGLDTLYSSDFEGSAARACSRIAGELDDITANNPGGTGLIRYTTALDQALESTDRAQRSPDKISGMSTGLIDLDKKLGGLHPGNLVIVAGRPGMGKSALARLMCRTAALHFQTGLTDDNKTVVVEGGRAALFTLEASAQEVAMLDLAAMTGIAAERQRRGWISIEKGEMTELQTYRDVLASGPYWVDETNPLTIGQLVQRARRLHRQQPLGIVAVDYLQLLDTDKQIDNRVLQIQAITKGLKALAKQLNIPVVALSQLSRKVEERDDKRPTLGDLRESGAIEQDADVILFPFREEYYLANQVPVRRANESDKAWGDRNETFEKAFAAVKGLGTIIVAKNKLGPVGDVDVAWSGTRTTFGNLERKS